MHLDLFPTPILNTFSPQPVLPLLFLDYLPSFLHKTSWEKWLAKKLKCSQMLLFRNWHKQTQQLVDRMIRNHKFHADLE